MPDNTWFTPYKIPAQQCLSFGPSQGIVYRLAEQSVIKVPFQYPVYRTLPPAEAKEKIYMSLRSFAVFKRESSFYDLLAERPHPNLAQRVRSKPSAIILQYFQPLEQAWSKHSRDTRFIWIQQLLSALEWLEDLGYTHGDLKIHNIGLDDTNQLRLFDFGSIRHRDEEGFHEQVLEDHFSLSTCIHYLASGVDPIAKAKSLTEVRKTMNVLRRGQGTVETEAKEFEGVIQAGWTGTLSSPSFSQVRKTVAELVPPSSRIALCSSGDPSANSQSVLDEVVLEEDTRWMNEEDCRATWRAEGFETPDDIWS